jgi:hypothetical protein
LAPGTILDFFKSFTKVEPNADRNFCGTLGFSTGIKGIELNFYSSNIHKSPLVPVQSPREIRNKKSKKV